MDPLTVDVLLHVVEMPDAISCPTLLTPAYRFVKLLFVITLKFDALFAVWVESVRIDTDTLEMLVEMPVLKMPIALAK